MLFKASDGENTTFHTCSYHNLIFLFCTSDEKNLFFIFLPGAFTHIETKEHGATFDRAPPIAHGIHLIRKKGFLLV